MNDCDWKLEKLKDSCEALASGPDRERREEVLSDAMFLFGYGYNYEEGRYEELTSDPEPEGRKGRRKHESGYGNIGVTA